MRILAIETSCDDTSAAVTENGNVLSNIISSQIIHNKYGGIVPELASRKHLEVISQIVQESLVESKSTMAEINAIAVTNSPGLAGSLLVGCNFAKGLSLKYDKPIIPINHIEGHIFSGNLQEQGLDFPLISLVVSGGHTAIFLVSSYTEYKLIGSTIDDAAGEAFDKIAKMLGLGYPGGPIIDKLAKDGDPKRFDFPRSMIHKSNFDFSFSGLKTSVRYFLQKNYPNGDFNDDLNDIAASVQEAITDVLVKKTIDATKSNKIKSIVIGGGVSANSRLREKFKIEANKINAKIILPDMEYCVDNAAMIAFVAEQKLINSDPANFFDLTFTADPNPIRK